jgi:hypothetical protein
MDWLTGDKLLAKSASLVYKIVMFFLHAPLGKLLFKLIFIKIDTLTYDGDGGGRLNALFWVTLMRGIGVFTWGYIENVGG